MSLNWLGWESWFPLTLWSQLWDHGAMYLVKSNVRIAEVSWHDSVQCKLSQLGLASKLIPLCRKKAECLSSSDIYVLLWFVLPHSNQRFCPNEETILETGSNRHQHGSKCTQQRFWVCTRATFKEITMVWQSASEALELRLTFIQALEQSLTQLWTLGPDTGPNTRSLVSHILV